jgi:hypothetical protein
MPIGVGSPRRFTTGRKRAIGTRPSMTVPMAPNERWSLDFVSDTATKAGWGPRSATIWIPLFGIENPVGHSAAIRIGFLHDQRADTRRSLSVQRLALDKSTFEWYKHRIDGGNKLLILLFLLRSDDSPPLGTIFPFAGVLYRPRAFVDRPAHS